MITDFLTALDNVYYYQGHMEHKSKDFIIVKVFGKRSVHKYYEELRNSVYDKSRHVVDSDKENHIIVEKVKSPSIVTLYDDSRYVLTKIVEANPSLMVYFGHKMKDEPINQVVLKFYAGEKGLVEYRKEKRCLRSLGRLIAHDGLQLILIERKIWGETLQNVLDAGLIEPEVLLEKCKNLLYKLQNNFGYTHKDINASNIIVTRNGDVEFINFSKSERLSSDPERASDEKIKDMIDLLKIFKDRVSSLHSGSFSSVVKDILD